jgi:hypothetical protein
VILICPESVRWVNDAGQILVIDERRGVTHTLRGVEAAVWDWLTLAYPYPALVEMLAALLTLPSDQSAERLGDILAAWQTAGLLEPKEKE